MLPKIIHYTWLGGAPLPELAERCIASWKKYMPDWEYRRWDEASLTQALSPQIIRKEGCWLDYVPLYVRQAYEVGKFAFVSDYVRLWALEKYGGLYMDVDFEVYRPFDDLMERYPAFAGYEGSKRQPVMQGVIASEPHGAWVRDMLSTYDTRPFVKPDGSYDMLPNTSYFSDRLESQGWKPEGKESDIYVDGVYFLHILPVWAFCPILTTGEDVRMPETYCEHKGLHSWGGDVGWKAKLLNLMSPAIKTRLIKLKRSIFG